MSTRPNSIYCHQNNYSVLGTSHDSLEVILYSDNEEDHRSFHPQQSPPPQQQSNSSIYNDIVHEPAFIGNEELRREVGEEDDIFRMDDIPNDLSASIASLGYSWSSNASDDSTSTAKLSTSPSTSFLHEPIDVPSSPIQVRYYVPTNQEPQGLSQSAVATTVDHHYIRRHLDYHQRRSLLQSTSYKIDDSEQVINCDSFDNEEDVVNAIINSDNISQYVPFPSSWSATGGCIPNIYSQSAPNVSYLTDDLLYSYSPATTEITAPSQLDSSSENQKCNSNDECSNTNASSYIEAVHILCEEVEETEHLSQPSIIIKAEELDIFSFNDREEAKEACLKADPVVSAVGEKEKYAIDQINNAHSESVEQYHEGGGAVAAETINFSLLPKEGNKEVSGYATEGEAVLETNILNKMQTQVSSSTQHTNLRNKTLTKTPIAGVANESQIKPDESNPTKEVDTNGDDNESWSLLADASYGPLPEFQFQKQLSEEESRWEKLYQQSELLKKLKQNTFILRLLNKYSCPLKVSNLPYTIRYKRLLDHFFDPSVLYIRYIRYERRAYVVYRSYIEMLKAYCSPFLTVVEGTTITCEPSTMEELEYDLSCEEQRKRILHNEEYMRIQFKNKTQSTDKTSHQGDSCTNTNMVKHNYRDTFIPGHHNIIYKRNLRKRNNTTNYVLSQMPVYDYGMTSYCIPYSYISAVPLYMSLSHPHQRNIAMTLLTADNPSVPSRPRRSKRKCHHRLPKKSLQLPILPVQYIIMKPNVRQDFSLAKRIKYYPIATQKYADILNHVFQISHQVVFLISIKGSSAFQGYAIMTSEVIALNQLSADDIKGTLFETLGTNFKTGKGNRKTPWRFVCRVEWKPSQTLPMHQIGYCVNGWNNNRLIRYSKDVTFVEPALGKTMVDMIAAAGQI